jgi:rubredoxin
MNQLQKDRIEQGLSPCCGIQSIIKEKDGKPTSIICPKCKNDVPSHRVCPNCGYYKNQDLLKLEEKTKAKEERRKTREEQEKSEEK